MVVAAVTLVGAACTPALQPSDVAGTYRTCGDYRCEYISVEENGGFALWATGEGALPKLRGRWSTAPDGCIMLDTDPPASQGYIEPEGSETGGTVYQTIKTLHLCFRADGPFVVFRGQDPSDSSSGVLFTRVK